MSADQKTKQAPRELPEIVTMPLLMKITQQSLDEDYRHVAERRASTSSAPGSPVSGRRLRRSTAVAVAAFGLLITIAAVQTSRNASADAGSRATLIKEVNRGNDRVAAQQTLLRNLREQTTDLQNGLQQLTQDAQAAEARVLRLEGGTGFTAVHGPGVRAVVDDGPDGDTGRVRDEDLAMLVDGLWNAGAEAISINGQRLTVLAPIRSSGVAIHVNNRPISPPYVILAIGDTRSMQSRFADSTHGLEWLSLVNTFGFQFEMHNEDSLELPGSRMPVLRAARLAGTDPERGKQEEVAP